MKCFLSLSIALLAISTNLCAAETGMPQLDPKYWASQAFWLILVFTILYISISKFYLPKIKDNLDNRENKIKEDLENASKFKEQAEAIIGKDAVIINMSQVPYIDASGTYVLEEVIKNFKTKNVEVILVGVKDHIFQQFEELKVIPNTLAEEKAYNSVRAGLKYLKFQLEENF